MKTKFGKKLLALFLAVLMSLTAFSGVLTAQAAAADPDYHDNNLTANALAWVELTDEQTAAALLDYLDDVLAGVALPIELNVDVLGILTISLNGTLDSVSGLLDIVDQVQGLLDSYGGLIGGDVQNINLSAIAGLSYTSVNTGYPACGKDYRANNSAKDILKDILTFIQDNTGNTNGNKAIIKQLLRGDFNFGIIGSFVDVWSELGGVLGDLLGVSLPSNYQSNLVFNLVTALLTGMTDWYTEEEAQNMVNQVEGYDLDTMLFKALSKNLIQQINVEVTYPDGTSSRDHYGTDAQDPNLCYTPDGNVYIFQYNSNPENDTEEQQDDVNLTITPTETLFQFSYEALEVAWKTVLAPTLGQLNYAVNNYDWDYNIWYTNKGYIWNYKDVASNYSQELLNEWASDEGLDLAQVQADLTFNRELVGDPSYNWRDIQSQYLFNKLCRSPLMVYGFGAETGPLNTNLKCTGTPNIDAFFAEDYDNYTSILGGFNDFLVAAVKDFLPDYEGASSLVTIGDTTDASLISTTLVSNALKVVQYVADATDANILSPFYHAYGDDTALTETNFEEAMVPFLIACLENNLDNLLGQIHKDKWDMCKDAEGVAVVALEEYLSNILPDRDYSSLITTDENGYYNVTLESAILPMCRDAIGYVMMQYVPVQDGNGNDWFVYDADVQTYDEQEASGTDIFTLLNSVVCYYAEDKGVAALLGICDTSGNSLVNTNKDLWENIDTVANALLPVFGELQYGDHASYGQFDSYDLIWNDIVSGVLNIGDTSLHPETNRGGITNFIYRLATIIGADPISSQGADITVYNLLKDLFNGLFNARYSNQVYYGQDVVPAAVDNHPFHTLIQRDVLAGASDNETDIGALGKLLLNVAEFGGIDGYPETIWDGAMFLVQAVASFIDGFIPQIQDYEVGDLDISLDTLASSAYEYGTQFNFEIDLTNLGHGINRFVREADGTVNRLDRSYIQIDSIVSDKNQDGFSYGSFSSRIAPEGTLTVPIQGSLNEGDFAGQTYSIVTFTVTYRIVDSTGAAYSSEYASPLTKDFYFYVSTQMDWEGLTYDSDSENGFTETIANNENGTTGNYSSTTPYIRQTGIHVGIIDTRAWANLQHPNSVVVRTSQLENIDYTVAVVAGTDTQWSIDAIVASNSQYGGNQYFAVTCDRTTGDLTNVFFYDYYRYRTETVEIIGPDGTPITVEQVVTDDEGNPIGDWITTDPLSRDAVLSLMDSDPNVVDYRHHVVVPYDEIDSYNFTTNEEETNWSYTAGSHYEDKNDDGSFNCIYIPDNGGDDYKKWIDYSQTDPNDLSLSSGIGGIALAFNKVTIQGSGTTTYPFLAWDQETTVTATDEPFTMNFMVICGQVRGFDMTITVADDVGEAEAVTENYLEAYNILANYKPEDFTDQNVYNYFMDSSMNGLAALVSPITAENAVDFGSTKANLSTYTTTTNPIGDVAYMPATASVMNAEGIADLRYDTVDYEGLYFLTNYVDSAGIEYYDNPIYQNVLVTEKDVVDTGRDIEIMEDGEAVPYDVYRLTTPTAYTVQGDTVTPYYDEVIYIRESGQDTTAQWHLLNDVQYEQEWVDAGSGSGIYLDQPYLQDTDVQATDAAGTPLYNENSFIYRTDENIASNSRDNWYVKLMDTEWGIIDDPASRGEMAVAADKLDYVLSFIYDYIAVNKAQDVFNDVYLLRNGLDNRDFDVINYEQMAAAGREAESVLEIDTYNEYYLRNLVGPDSEVPVIECLASEFEDELEAYNALNETNYKANDFNVVVDYEQSQASSSATSFQLTEALRLFELYLARVEERGYIGDKLEEEISCAVNGKSNENKDNKDTSYAIVSVDLENASYSVGDAVYTADNNPDGVTYSEESWAAFLEALDTAVDAAVTGNSTYPYAAPAIFQAANKDQYTLQVSDVYGIRTKLMRAENGLTVAEAQGYMVSAYVGALVSPDDAEGAYATTGAVVTIQTDNGPIEATTDSTGKFTLENVPNGTYEATITYRYGFDRTFTIVVEGADVDSNTMVGIVACNWDGNNTSITATDLSIYSIHANETSSSPNYDIGLDIDLNNSITASDLAIYAKFANMTASQIPESNIVIQN